MGHFPIPEERLVALLSGSKMNSLEREKCVSVYCSDWSYVPPTYVRHLKNRSADFGGTISSGFGGTNAIQHGDETIIILREYFLATWKVIQ